MQFTGRRDVHAQEICAGDVLQTKDGSRWVVRFQYGGFGAQLKMTPGLSSGDWLGCATIAFTEMKFERIGNVYDDPALLCQRCL